MKRILITAGDITVSAELNESPTALRILEALPIEAEANTWGEEIYFEIPVKAEQAPDARQDVEVGELGYWPMGSGFCIFFGRTPVSTGDKPRAYSPVNIIGRVTGDTAPLRTVRDGARVLIKRGMT